MGQQIEKIPNWRKQFFKIVPILDENGKPLKDNPPLNKKGFWEKPDFHGSKKKTNSNK
jgi:hypothetical protein